LPIALVWLSLFAFVGLSTVSLRASYISSAERLDEQVRFSARLAEDRATMTFERGNQTLLDAIDDILPSDLLTGRAIAEPRLHELEARLKEHAERFPAIVSIALTDSDGTVFANSSGAMNGVFLGDRDYFQSLKNGDSRNPLFTTVLKGRVSGKWGMQLVRSIILPDGRFGGALLANIGLDEGFINFYRTLPMAPTDLLTLHDSNTNLLVRFPVTESNLGRPVRSPALIRAIAKGDWETVVVEKSPIDGIDRLLAFRKSGTFPIYLAYGRSLDQAFQAWRHELLQGIAFGVFALLATLIITVGLIRRDRLTIRLAATQAALQTNLAATEKLAMHDQLTGLLNRRAFNIRLEETIARADRSNLPFSLMLLDLDHFKEINDSFGHAAGDTVLVELAKLLGERLRQTDIAARWGGEEFVVIAEGSPVDQAKVLAEQIRQTMAQRVIPNLSISPTVSIGLAGYSRGETDIGLMRKADTAMYEAKHQGRNRTVALE